MEINFRTYSSSEKAQESTPVIMLVTTGEQKLVIPTDIIIKETDWDSTSQKVKGDSLPSMTQNLQLVRLETKLLQYYNTCLLQQKPVDADQVITLLLKKEERDEKFSPEIKSTALSAKELKSLQSLSLADGSLEKVRDVYLFICYSGIPYHYVNRLDRAQLKMINSQWCLRATAETPFAFPIRLVKKAVSIIRKWEGAYKPGTEQVLLPEISGLSVPAILLELAQLAHVQTALSWDNAIKTHWETFITSNVLK